MCKDPVTGQGYPAGTVVRSQDGCGQCVCGWKDAIANLTSATNFVPTTRPEWLCGPIVDPTMTQCCLIDGVAYRPGSPIRVDRNTCQRCWCDLNGRPNCTSLSTTECGVCIDGTTRYVPGDTKPAADECNRCTCSNGAFVCSTDACQINCVHIRIDVTLKLTANTTNQIDLTVLIARLDALFGRGKWSFVALTVEPGTTRFTIDIPCYNTKFDNANDAAEDAELSLTTSLTNSGVAPTDASSSVVDPGTEVERDSAVTTAVSSVVVIVAALLAIVAF